MSGAARRDRRVGDRGADRDGVGVSAAGQRRQCGRCRPAGRAGEPEIEHRAERLAAGERLAPGCAGRARTPRRDRRPLIANAAASAARSVSPRGGLPGARGRTARRAMCAGEERREHAAGVIGSSAISHAERAQRVVDRVDDRRRRRRSRRPRRCPSGRSSRRATASPCARYAMSALRRRPAALFGERVASGWPWRRTASPRRARCRSLARRRRAPGRRRSSG